MTIKPEFALENVEALNMLPSASSLGLSSFHQETQSANQ